jgi:hypothetical protein
MRRNGWLVLMLCQLIACDGAAAGAAAERKLLAERFFRGVYGCEPAAVPELASDSVLISYPIFEELFNTPTIRGRENVEEFAVGFCSRWKDAQITIHEAIADGDQVVLVWSSGRIVVEIGEESEPGPVERVAAGSDSA